mmetsp:Transcript_14230/g.32342  ORF Transcript_14230/g.32342 Transcript_14230/m.32342 type:complete len:467 (-) Transcript_14230:177-1577(-)
MRFVFVARWLVLLSSAAELVKGLLSTHPINDGLTKKHCKSKHVHRGTSRFEGDESKKDDDTRFFQELRERAQELSQQTQELTSKWRTGDCRSKLPLVFPDWVRRIDIDYPLVACGSSRETVFLGHLETGEILAESTFSIDDDESNDEARRDEKSVDDLDLMQTMRFLFGNYDGGGTLSIAFQDSLICEGGRKGGVRVWRTNPTSNRLVSQGSIPAMEGLLATCLHIDDNDRLWVGTHKGEVHCYRLDDPFQPLALQTKPYKSWTFGRRMSCVMSLELCVEFSCGVATLAGGSVEFFSTNENEAVGLASLYPPFDSMERRPANIYPSQASFVLSKKNKNSDDISGLSIVCGGSDGSMYSQSISLTNYNQDIDRDRPFQEPLEPMGQGHPGGGIIKAMVSPTYDMLVSLGQDGCMKVWDMQKRTPFYHFAGYKVWTGSLWTDGRRIASDGVDNTVLLHDFAGSDDELY